jgi:undecaprenyl-diphosphatase
MDLLQAILLGIMQGITEFLPISSDGHLALMQNYFGEINVGFDIILHFATLLAIIAFFWKDIIIILRDFFSLKYGSENFKIALFIIIGSIPAAIFGFLLVGKIENIFSNLLITAMGFFITGTFLMLASYIKKIGGKLNYSNSFIIGIAQALAILPGLSRSGATVSTGLLFGLDKEKAIKFSFLLSIPAILGANILSIGRISALDIGLIVPGFLSAFIFGLFAIFIFIKYLKINNLKYFAFYCWMLAILCLIFYFT